MKENKNAGVSPNNGKVRSRFSGKLGYVLAVAGSAVGLGTSGDSRIWQQSTAEACSCWCI